MTGPEGTSSASVSAWIALGSNVGARRATLDAAARAIGREAGLRVLRLSGWVETEAVGGPPGQRPYRNGVAELECSLPARRLLVRLHAIEARFGRDRAREVRNGPRTLDLDILFYGEEVLDEPDLEVPHPRLEERVFVLEPLARLAPERWLARSGKTVRERLEELSK